MGLPSPRVRPSLARSALSHLRARAPQGAKPPLPSVPSVALSAPSATARRGRLRAFGSAQIAVAVPSASAPVSPCPRGSPLGKPFLGSRSKGGGSRRRPLWGLRLGWADFPPPPLKGGLKHIYRTHLSVVFLSPIPPPFPQGKGAQRVRVQRGNLGHQSGMSLSLSTSIFRQSFT